MNIITAAEAIKNATENGYIELASGVYLNSSEYLQEDQLNWFNENEDGGVRYDFASSPYWLTTNDGFVLAITGKDDQDLIDNCKQESKKEGEQEW